MKIAITIAVFIFLVIAGYNSLKYWEREERLINLSEKEIENNRVADSLQTVVNWKDTVISKLLQAKGTEKESRTELNVNYQKRKEEIKKTAYSDDKRFNDDFIFGFKPKY